MTGVARPLFGRLLKSAPGAFYYLLLLVLIPWIIASRIYNLEAAPPGLFFDESSIGYNAIRIMETGYDEHGKHYPVYFESVGDYKNPVFIYAVAFVFKLLGASEFNLRLTSALFFGFALLFSVLLIRKIFDGNRILTIYALIGFGFTPLFFVLSRVAFEVITQWTLVSAATLTIWAAFHGRNAEKGILFPAIVSGGLLGLSTYSYTTQRLLSSLMLVVLWAVYINRNNFKKLLALSFAYLIALIPFLVFSFNNPGIVAERFLELSYVDDPLPFSEKASIFFGNYGVYWSPDFLIFHGDPNLRHSTGYGGVLFVVTIVLFVLGFLHLLLKKRRERFPVFLLVNLTISPIAAALVTEGAPHALRSMLVVYYILLISCYGLAIVIDSRWHHVLKTALLTCLFLAHTLESARYQRDYFVSYPARSVEDFGSFDLRSAIEFSLEHRPDEISAIGLPPGGYANIQFYSGNVENPAGIPIAVDDFREPKPGLCLIFHRRTDIESKLDAYSLPYDNFSSRKKLSPMEHRFSVEKFNGVIKVRCYEREN